MNRRFSGPSLFFLLPCRNLRRASSSSPPAFANPILQYRASHKEEKFGYDGGRYLLVDPAHIKKFASEFEESEKCKEFVDQPAGYIEDEPKEEWGGARAALLWALEPG